MTVNKLRNNDAKEVADLAKELVRKWKADVGQSGSKKSQCRAPRRLLSTIETDRLDTRLDDSHDCRRFDCDFLGTVTSIRSNAEIPDPESRTDSIHHRRVEARTSDCLFEYEFQLSAGRTVEEAELGRTAADTQGGRDRLCKGRRGDRRQDEGQVL